MKYLTNDDNPAGDGWYDDGEAAVLLEHATGWSEAKAPKDDPDPTKDAAPHSDGRGAAAVPGDPDGVVDAAGRPVADTAPKRRRGARTKPTSNGDGDPDNGGDAGQEN